MFNAGSGLTVGSASHVRLVNGAQACNVFWKVGSSATIGTGATFVGNILALSSISLTTGVTLDGRALARNGAVTLDTDTITRSTCTTPALPPAGTGSEETTSPGIGVPSPGAPAGGCASPGNTTAPTASTGKMPAATAVPAAVVTTLARTVGATAVSSSAVTMPVIKVGTTTARVEGTAQSSSRPATYTFQYGTAEKYGRHTKPGTSGSSKKWVKRVLRGLKPGQRYHYRVVVVGPTGSTTYGKDRTFRTWTSRDARPRLCLTRAVRLARPGRTRRVPYPRGGGGDDSRPPDRGARAHPERLPRPVEQGGLLTRIPVRRPLTHARTVLPVLSTATDALGHPWLRVLIPGRPNGRTGWIRESGTIRDTTPWAIEVRRGNRTVLVRRGGAVVRSFRSIVGAPATPTPLGRFFVEEVVRVPAGHAAGPYALALSARSTVLQEFAGGPGQIALHGKVGLGGTLGTAVSHGCLRLTSDAIRWLASRIGPGVSVTIQR